MSETVTVTVRLLAFGQNGLRAVEIPKQEWDAAETDAAKLELVFYYGQNDFQPRPCPSVSVGDVVLLGGAEWRVAVLGFEKLEARS